MIVIELKQKHFIANARRHEQQLTSDKLNTAVMNFKDNNPGHLN